MKGRDVQRFWTLGFSRLDSYLLKTVGKESRNQQRKERADRRKQMKIVSYITFNGNAREAMTFYREALGGELSFMEVGGSAMEEHLPHMNKTDIVHGQLDLGNLTLMGSDMVGPQGYTKDSNITLMLLCESEALVHEKYAKLSEGGQAVIPPAPAFWGGIYGHLVDKYGTEWGVHWSEDLVNRGMQL